MAIKLGDYSVLSGGAPVNFWPLNPGTTVAQATPQAPIAPANPNTLVQPPRFAIFDVLIQVPDEPVVQATIAEPALLNNVSGAATINSMPLIQQAGGTRICFAVSPSSGNNFEGTLKLSAKNGSTTYESKLAIKGAVNSRIDDLVVLFVVHDHVPKTYAWVKMRVVQSGAGAAPIASASVTAKILRDNITFKKINRSISLQTGANGFMAQGTRDVIGLPIDWPILFNASAAGYVSRGHMIRLKAADVHDDLIAFQPATSLQMTRLQDASLAGKKILLDPGHGVVYGHTARRSQEWYVASRIADRIGEILVSDHGLSAADLFRTRTAGFGLIEPSQMGTDAAPESGKNKFEYDMVAKRIRIRQTTGANAAGLKDLSNLVLTTHSDPGDVAQAISPAARKQLLDLNPAALVSITARLNGQHMSSNRRVRPGTLRWDTGTNNYRYTHDPLATPGSGGQDANIPITPDDWFSIDDAMLRTLIDRSARWSIAREVKGGPLGLGGRPLFTDAARNAMIAAGARDYMKRKIWEELHVAPPHQYLDHGPHGWGPTVRMLYINGTPCDLYISLHENFSGLQSAAPTADLGNAGGYAVVSRLTGINAPPDQQIRLGKIMLKYLDPVDQGLRSGGVGKEEQGNPVGMLHAQDPNPPNDVDNTMRDKHAYFELEFMDGVDAATPNQYRYETMVGGAFVERVARQIVNGIVEALLAPQTDLDSIKLNNQLPPLW